MPFKICTGCQSENGPRTYYCQECGAPFTNTLKKGGKRIIGNKNIVNDNKNKVVVNNNITFTGSKPTVTTFRGPLPVFENSEINLDPSNYYSGMINREAQINILLSAARTAVETDFKIRNHILFTGPPAGGKTSLTNCFINMVGEDLCYKIDATTSTQSGILQELTERQGTVKFLVLEEIDKVKNKGEEYRWLLSAMDERAEIRTCNAKIGYVHMPFPVLVIATCNDVNKLEGFMGGALYSRFINKVHCPRLDDDAIFKAIQKYVRIINGDDAWINPVINYVRREKGTDDIRTMIGYVTDGRERIATGEYFDILRSVNNN